jgi:hypothetical protein
MYFAPAELVCKNNDVGYKHFVPLGRGSSLQLGYTNRDQNCEKRITLAPDPATMNRPSVSTQ